MFNFVKGIPRISRQFKLKPEHMQTYFTKTDSDATVQLGAFAKCVPEGCIQKEMVYP